jgi:hypothetical protein
VFGATDGHLDCDDDYDYDNDDDDDNEQWDDKRGAAD